MNLSKKDLINLPMLPEKVDFFICSDNKLTNLNGSPKKVKSHFDCSYNFLTDLNGSPNYVGGFINCHDNNLTSLFGVPKIIKGFFNFLKNPKLLDISELWDSDIKGTIYFDFNSGMTILPLIKFNSLSCNNN